MKRPNFVLFITDQHRADYLGCYGHPTLHTPNIDKMADGGIAFDRFYVSAPVCMPNRASLMTCRVPSSHGVRMNGIPLDKAQVTFVDLLRDAGYDTALIGKSHLQTFSDEEPALRRRTPRDGFHQAGGNYPMPRVHALTIPSIRPRRPEVLSIRGIRPRLHIMASIMSNWLRGMGMICAGITANGSWTAAPRRSNCSAPPISCRTIIAALRLSAQPFHPSFIRQLISLKELNHIWHLARTMKNLSF